MNTRNWNFKIDIHRVCVCVFFHFKLETWIGGGVVDVFIGNKTSNGIVLQLGDEAICNVD